MMLTTNSRLEDYQIRKTFELVTLTKKRASKQESNVIAIDVRSKKLVNWSKMLAVGVKIVDEQHMMLIDTINQLNGELYLNHVHLALDKALKELSTYAIYHFDTEERLMARHRYEMSEAHKADHELFNVTIKQFGQLQVSGHLSACVEIMNFLREWLFVHIMKTDKELGVALNQLGIV